MSYRIVVDSCGELTQEMKDSGCFVNVPLTITVGEHHIVDDETFDQADFLKKVAGCPDCPKSSCPSPEKYMESYRCDADHVYAVTLSANLSGSYNSAVLGKNLYEEEYTTDLTLYKKPGFVKKFFNLIKGIFKKNNF